MKNKSQMADLPLIENERPTGKKKQAKINQILRKIEKGISSERLITQLEDLYQLGKYHTTEIVEDALKK